MQSAEGEGAGEEGSFIQDEPQEGPNKAAEDCEAAAQEVAISEESWRRKQLYLFLIYQLIKKILVSFV